MRVLVLESEPGVAAYPIDQLEHAGHQVARCHDADAPAFPCDAMIEGRECPLDDGPISVALIVGADRKGEDEAHDFADHDGARCAARRHVPIVVAGSSDKVTATVERAAATPLVAHGKAAAEALRSVLELHDLDPSQANAEVVRHGDELRVVLRPGPGIVFDKRVGEVASIRALAAVRTVDSHARNVTISLD